MLAGNASSTRNCQGSVTGYHTLVAYVAPRQRARNSGGLAAAARGDGGEAKFWLAPKVHVAESYGLDGRILRELAAVVSDRAQLIEKAWHDHFS